MNEQARIWRNAGLAGIAFGLLYGPVLSWLFGWLPPDDPGELATLVMLTTFSGALFALLIGLIMSWVPEITAANIPLAPGETIVLKGPANHFKGLEARGGTLTLTDRRLVFTPHALNIQRSGLSVARSEIESAVPARTLGVVPNGLLIRLASGAAERFVVNNRDEWAERLAKA